MKFSENPWFSYGFGFNERLKSFLKRIDPDTSLRQKST